MKLSNLFLSLVVTATASLAAVGCSSKGESGLTKTDTLGTLSTDDQKTLCTWMLNETGGPEKETKCTGADGKESTKVNHSEATCESNFDTIRKLHDAGCDVTVEETENCTAELKADACGTHATCDAIEKRIDACDVKK